MTSTIRLASVMATMAPAERSSDPDDDGSESLGGRFIGAGGGGGDGGGGEKSHEIDDPS